ncbi:hypothetical protein C8R45DRAFT_992076 [Mycena sanguinolenta]|nr:hypothetical protein C8R45DRAFT_992076 [Mycena sanguinolenta]
MSEQAALVAREARSIHGGLKTLLAGDVWANYREADFQRKNLRRRYLHLLLLYPNARETRDAGTHLWMQTSYAFIALYKQRLAALSAHANATGDNTNTNNNHHNSGNDKREGNRKQVESRKLLQRFRQFLADEDRFWRALVGRVQRAYGVVLPSHFAGNGNLPPELLGGAAAVVAAGVTAPANAGEGGEDAVEDRMNHFGFPSALPADSNEGVRVDEGTAHSVLSKALVCLGDIARYREQYKFPPKGAAHNNYKGHNVKKGNNVYIEPRPNYARARALYLAAHALAPAEGNAAHQLAILAGYESDTLASLAWYLRALCVRAPFDTAGENLAGVLARVSAAERRSGSASGGGGKRVGKEDGLGDVGREDDPTLPLTDEEEERDPPRVRIERFRREVVLLHALWRGSTPPTQTLAFSAHTARAFARLVAARALPEELIVRVVLLSQGAVWVGRMVVVPPTTAAATTMTINADAEKGKEKGRKHGRNISSRTVSSTTLDAHAENENLNGNAKDAKKPAGNTSANGPGKQAAHLAHLLALHTALLDVGVRELGEVDVYSVPAAPVPVSVPPPPARGGHGGRGRRHGRRGGGAEAAAVPPLVGGGMAISGAGGGMGGGLSGPGTGANLAERISAEFRRTLPALRVASKWLLANWGWVREFVGEDSKAGGPGSEGEGEEEAALAAQRVRFWAAYADFLRLLARTFPAGLLPKLTVEGGEVERDDQARDDEGGADGDELELELELEEDVDVRGWLPLRGLMGGPCPLPPHLEEGADASSDSDNDFFKPARKGKGKRTDEEKDGEGRGSERRTVGLREEVHPNVEQLMRIADLLRDARRVVGLEGSPLALYGNQFVVKGVEAAKPAGVVPPVPTPFFTQAQKQYAPGGVQPPAMNVSVRMGINANSARMQQELAMDVDDLEDDAMTEQTSRTDDDLLHDAFSFLNRAESESEAAEDEKLSDDEDGDEIVWDLRDRDAPVSPIMPTARTSPKTPVRLAPLSAPLPLSPFRVPQPLHPPQQPITLGTQVPATTALDLLNTFAKKPVSSVLPPVGMGAVGGGGGAGMGINGGAGDGLLFGPRTSAPQTQSIWSASKDERGLMFASGSSQQQQYQQVNQHTLAPQFQGLAQSAGYAEHAHPQHHRFASQDLASSQGSTIWASSYPSASQHHVPSSAGATSSFGPPPPTHQRVVSSSMTAAQLFPSGGDQYGYGSVSAPAPQYVPSNAEMGVLYATSGQGHGFAAQQQQGHGHGLGLGQTQTHGHGHGHGHGQHSRHLSLDPRAAPFHGHGQPLVSMSQLWGNVG